MKDAELRELLTKIENRIDAAVSVIRGGSDELTMQLIKDRLARIQELCEQGQRFPAIELPSSRVPLFVGAVVGGLLFAAGMLLGWLVLK